jgi:hypothetical protein
MTGNSSWHSAAWVEAEKALAAAELNTTKKTASACLNRWTAVCRLFLIPVEYFTLSIF